jgi:hypothetical protein
MQVGIDVRFGDQVILGVDLDRWFTINVILDRPDLPP